MTNPEFLYWMSVLGIISSVVALVLDVLSGHWGWAAFMAVCAAVNVWNWRKHRRNRRRRRALALLGDKSRRLRDAMVARVREAGRPRPVLRPVPQGAR